MLEHNREIHLLDHKKHCVDISAAEPLQSARQLDEN